MSDFKITPEAQKMLDRLSLVSYVRIYNGFTGLYMTAQLRVWYCEAEIRLEEHRIRFIGRGEYNPRLPIDISDAIRGTFLEVENYVKSHPELQDYWDSDESNC